MSGGTVFRHALRSLRALRIPSAAERDVVRALDAAFEPRLLQLFYEAAAEAELPREDMLARAAGCFLSFAAGNLADDLVDGDCVYLDDPVRDAPTIQFLLQNAAWQLWLSSRASRSSLVGAAAALAAAAGPQQLEVRTDQWTKERFAEVGEGVAGRQWEAYLAILWSGSRLESRAVAVGRAMGIAGHIVEDYRTDDPRFFTMSREDQRAILAQAFALTTELRTFGSETAVLIADVFDARLPERSER